MADHSGALRGRRILIVEDEYIVALDLAQSFEQIGAAVVGPVGSVASALALLSEETALDMAVLDINLGREKVFLVADALRARGLPFVFASGYDASSIPGAYRDVPRFEKPIDINALARELECQPARDRDV
ncbi:MAG TPA: response regulator [Reyranella sp.]|nr:response regulator [Reyranella sp.]